MSDPRDYKLDLTSLTPEAPPAPPASPTRSSTQNTSARPFLRVHFACCNVYLRLYRNESPTPHYAGACPKCAKSVRFNISSTGSASRDFTVY